MGTLVAMKYPTILMANAADHTYVQCGNGGKAWGCWGGSTGGDAFNSGTGSTRRADRIAGTDEKAGIRCYLVNGVCHQAANRILYPAGILVSGARGYALSSLTFGTYGKVRFGPCRSPFDKHATVSGELAACVGAASSGSSGSSGSSSGSSGSSGSWFKKPTLLEVRFLRSVKQAYDRYFRKDNGPVDEMNFAMALFDREIDFRLGNLNEKERHYLLHAKQRLELNHTHLTQEREQKKLSLAEQVEFIRSFNDMTLAFQEDIANILPERRYKQLMEVSRDEHLVLADPDILRKLYGEKVAQGVYGKI